MINFNNYTIQSDKNVYKALKVINSNVHKIVFILQGKELVGSLTDGDVRRALLNYNDLEENVSCIMKKDFINLHYKSSNKLIRSAFRDYLRIIPLVNDDNELVDFADAFSGD